MNISQFIRLIQKNLVYLLLVPVMLAILVWYFTRNEEKTYISSTVVYTGIASGMNIESQEPKNVDFFGVKIIFDNFINIVESRETMEETGIELFAQNLMLKEVHREYISPYNYSELQRNTPQEVKDLIVKGNLEATKDAMLDYKNQNDTNYLYRLLNLNDKHYSVKAISSIKVKRINNSDLLKIEYSNNDPGITKQTLVILTRVFIKKYKALQQGQSLDVVKYFEEQVAIAAARLKDAEDRLLVFNQDNNIINYYEQSKYIAAQKEELGVMIQTVRMDLVAAEAAVQELESKLNKKELIKLNSRNILDYRNRLSAMSAEEAYLNTLNQEGANKEALVELERKKKALKKELELEIKKLSLISASKEGLPLQKILSSWLINVVKLEETKSQLSILNERKMEFEQTYRKFAPLGATMKRIEREIDVAERAYLELLHSLSLAKLKQQNIEMSSSVEIVDNPYFPIKAQPSKRKVLIVAAALIGGLFTLALIIILEYLDSTIKTVGRAIKLTELELAAVFPRMVNTPKNVNIDYVKQRMLEMLIQFIKRKAQVQGQHKKPIVLSFVSTQRIEGKTLISGELAKTLQGRGYKVMWMSESFDNFEEMPDEGYSKFNLDKPLSEVEDLCELWEGECDKEKYDFVIIEYPSLIYFETSDYLIKQSDLALLTVRSNRNWNKADTRALDSLKQLRDNDTYLILNGVDVDSLSDVLGEVPKKRSRIRRIVKKLVTLQHRSRYGFGKK
jgi:succinoglycan biosynthesis transport protein ExoP